MGKKQTEEDKIKNFKKNLIRFFIGIILLGIGFAHLNQNPAEKTSMTSGISILYQKAKLFVYSIFDQNAELYQKKVKLQQNYKELLSQLQKSTCGTPQQIEKTKKKLEKLKNISIEKFKKNGNKYYDFASQTYKEIKGDCN